MIIIMLKAFSLSSPSSSTKHKSNRTSAVSKYHCSKFPSILSWQYKRCARSSALVVAPSHGSNSSRWQRNTLSKHLTSLLWSNSLPPPAPLKSIYHLSRLTSSILAASVNLSLKQQTPETTNYRHCPENIKWLSLFTHNKQFIDSWLRLGCSGHQHTLSVPPSSPTIADRCHPWLPWSRHSDRRWHRPWKTNFWLAVNTHSISAIATTVV